MTPMHDHLAPLHSLVVRPRPWLSLVPAPDEPTYTQGLLALTYPLPNGLDAEPRSSAVTLVRGSYDAALPAPDMWAPRFLQAVVEVVSSDRPLTQLARWTAPPVYAAIAQAQRDVAARRLHATGRPTRQFIASVHVCRVQAGRAEVAARVVGGRRSRALAARLDYEHDRWTCTALQLG